MDKTKSGATAERVEIKMVQNVLLIWLDTHIDNNSNDCRNTMTQLRQVVNEINTFTDGEACIQFINTITNSKACMIMSGSLGQHIVPRVHNMSQVDSIFIFCGNKQHHEEWTKKWSKIKGVFTKIKPICETLKEASRQCEQNAISISFVGTGVDTANKSLDRLDPLFMYTQIMKEIILTIKFEQEHFQEFIEHCRDLFPDNETELKNINKFGEKYRSETPIWWYTNECFLYPMLNRALRTTDVNIIVRMGFFISDLHRHIEELHKKQFSGDQAGKTFTVYRGQGMSKTQFDELMNTKGGLMSFNNFLSTSKDREVSLRFARKAVEDSDSVAIFFIMKIDPSKSTTPFASINDVSYFKGKEDEVLFSMHTVFRIQDIKPMDEKHRPFQVDLTLTNDDDKDLRILSDRIRESSFPHETGWYRLGSVLFKMGESEKAQQVFQALLDQETDESEKAPIYNQLGLSMYKQKDYKQALTYYEKSLEIKQKTLPANHINLAHSYSNIGSVYVDLGDFSKALSSYEKALHIKQQSLPPNHADLAASYNNIGLVYDNMGDNSKALSFYEKALEIKQQSLPANHPDLAVSCSNIGLLYEDMGNYSKARSFHERAMDIGQRSLPPNHPHLQEYKDHFDRVNKKF
jgi:tetratricopeptide (TPR) repeat protein